MRLKALVLPLLLASAGQELAAQTRTTTIPVVAGSRVRVKTPTLVAPMIANFLEQRGDTLVFIEDGRGRGLWSFDINQIERLETTAGEASGNRQPMVRGALIGGGVGLAAGVLFAALAEPSDPDKKYSQGLSGAVGAAVGAGIGAFLGSRVKAERWVSVPLPGRLSLVPSPRGGFTLTIGLR